MKSYRSGMMRSLVSAATRTAAVAVVLPAFVHAATINVDFNSSDGGFGTYSGTAAAPEPVRTLRVGTVVWGLVVTAVGVGLLSVAWGAHLDTELAFIVLLGAAGVALLVGSLVGMRRSRHRLEGRG